MQDFTSWLKDREAASASAEINASLDAIRTNIDDEKAAGSTEDRPEEPQSTEPSAT